MKLSTLILTLSSLAVPLGASAGERLYLQVPVRFTPNITVVGHIKAECDLEQQMSVNAEAGISKRYGPVILAGKGDDVGNDKVLKLTIMAVDGIGGGVWTGAKGMTVQAELMQGGTVLGSKFFSRSSRGVNMFAGTCDLMRNATEALGSDIGKWLKSGAFEAAGKSADSPN